MLSRRPCPHPNRALHLEGIEAGAIHAAVTEGGLSRRVRAGENRVQMLHHAHVVRIWSGALSAKQAIELGVPVDLDPARSRILVWAEDSAGGTLEGLALPYAACDP